MLANRTPELQLFKQIVRGDNPNRILLIQGESGVGKTELLSQFSRHVPQSIPCISIDLRTAQFGVGYILSALRT